MLRRPGRWSRGEQGRRAREVRAPAAGGQTLAGWAGLGDDAHLEWGHRGLRPQSCGLRQGKEARVRRVVKACFQVAPMAMVTISR